jgi:hypothetical protein
VFSGSGFGPYSSNTTVTGDSDTNINHFSVAAGESTTPEPGSLLLVGGGLLAAALFGRRKRAA